MQGELAGRMLLDPRDDEYAFYHGNLHVMSATAFNYIYSAGEDTLRPDPYRETATSRWVEWAEMWLVLAYGATILGLKESEVPLATAQSAMVAPVLLMVTCAISSTCLRAKNHFKKIQMRERTSTFVKM